MRTKFYVESHIPHGSGDAEYRIMNAGEVLAIVDPNMVYADSGELADRICKALNENADAIA